MDQEEKAGMDSFMGGETAYENVLDRSDYYFADASEMLMFPGA